MEPPINFIPLRAAADALGHALHGASWRCLDDVDKAEIWLDPQIGNVITMIAEACERGEVTASHEALGPPDPLPRREWQSRHWRSFFSTGAITLNLPLLDQHGQPTGTGTARCTRKVFVRRDDLDRFIAKLHAEQAIPELKAKTPPFSKVSAAVFVSDYLKNAKNPTMEGVRMKAKGRGNRPLIDAEYRRQMREITGKPVKQGPRARNPRGKSAEK